MIGGASHTGKTGLAQRLDDSDCTMKFVLQENAQTLDMCKKHNADYLLIDDEYNVDLEL